MSADTKILNKIGRISDSDSFIDVPLGLAAKPHLLGSEIDPMKLRQLGRQYMHVLGSFGSTSYEHWADRSPKVDHGTTLRLIPDNRYRDCEDAIVEGRFIGRREDIIEGPHERLFVITYGFGCEDSRMAGDFIRGMLEAMAIQAERLKSPCSAFDVDKYRRTIKFNVFSPTDLLGVQSLLP